MSKSRRTVSLDEEIDGYLDREGVNASELVNRLVRNYMSCGDDKQALLELREVQLTSELDELDSRRSVKESELERVREELVQQDEAAEDVVEEARQVIPSDSRTVDNPAVENWAKKAGMDTEEFLDAM